MTGVIVRIVPQKQFGFIKSEGGKEYFFHKTDFEGHWLDIENEWENNEIKVEFEGMNTPKGLRAANVIRVREIL